MRLRLAILTIFAATLLAQAPITFQYFYDDTGQLIKVIDSTGISIEYVYDAVGNMLQIKRTTVTPGVLTIFNFTPSQSGPLSTITIQGQGFSTTPSANTVLFNGTPGTVLSATSTQLVVSVPIGATSGPITVKVGGSTAASTASFTALPIPVILSINPDGGLSGIPLNVVVTGVNLTNATFSFSSEGAKVTAVSSATPTQATLVVTPGAMLGVYDVQGNGSFSPVSDGTKFVVLPASWEANVQLSVLNILSPTPGTSLAETTLSIRNILSPTPGTSGAETILSVRNLQSAISGTNAAESVLAVLNMAFPAGSNFLESIPISVLNQGSGGGAAPSISADAAKRSRTEPMRIVGLNPVVTAGATVRLLAEPGIEALDVEFWTNGARLTKLSQAPYEAVFLVPAGIPGIEVRAVARGADGSEVSSLERARVVLGDTARLSGSVDSAEGVSAPGARIFVRGAGLRAEYFDFDRPLTTLPDLEGKKPTSRGFVSSLNLRNPWQVFGSDPLGVGLAPDYAARFRGEIGIEVAGEHRFYLRSHAGSRLKIDGRMLIEVQAGSVEPEEASAGIALTEGWHAIEVEHYEAAGGPELQLSWERPGKRREAVGSEYFLTDVVERTTADESGAWVVEGLPGTFGRFYVGADREGRAAAISAASGAIELKIILK